MRQVAVLLVLTLGASPRTCCAQADPDSEGPPITQIRSALQDAARTDERGERARRLLRASPDAVLLPSLRRIAGAEDGSPLVFEILDEVSQRPSREAVALFVDILAGRTALPADICWQLSLLIAARPDFCGRLNQSAAFRELVLAQARGPRRKTFIIIAELLRWSDCIDEIRHLMHDPDYGVRHTAVLAARTLTGREMPLPEAPVRFPSSRAVPGLLGVRRSLTVSTLGSIRSVALLHGFDGSPALAVTAGKALFLFDSALELRQAIQVDAVPHCVHALCEGDTARAMVVLASEYGVGYPETLGRVAPDGGLAWTPEPAGIGYRSHAILSDRNGDVGIVGMRADGAELRAMNIDGAQMWTMSLEIVGERIATSKRLPGQLVMRYGPDLVGLWSYDRTGLHPRKRDAARRHIGFSCRDAALCSDAQGRALVVLAGNELRGSLPALRGLRLDTGESWSAGIPAPDVRLAVYQPAEGADLCILVTENDEIMVFTCTGQLVAREPLRAGGDHRATELVGLVAGRLGSGEDVLVFAFREAVTVVNLGAEAVREACTLKGSG